MRESSRNIKELLKNSVVGGTKMNENLTYFLPSAASLISEPGSNKLSKYRTNTEMVSENRYVNKFEEDEEEETKDL